MGALVRAMDWSQTSLGAPDGWPQGLRSAVAIMLASRAQIILFWGPDLVAIYNDAYIPVLGSKHPWALGKPARECWSEIWEDTLGPLFQGVLDSGESFYARDLPFFLERHGYLEETYFDVSYDPARDETGAVAGVFCIVSETLDRVIGNRRLASLRDLGAIVPEVRTTEQACLATAIALERNPTDVPFALFYRLDEAGTTAHLAAAASLAPEDAAAPATLELNDPSGWPLGAVARSGEPVVVDDVAARFGNVSGGQWPDPIQQALVMPIAKAGQAQSYGFLVVGVSPRRALDDSYKNFLTLIGNQVAGAVSSAAAYEEEKRRAEALAELDRAKTAFFSNVSHEFRTPLTLILRPIADALEDPNTIPANRERLLLAHRNAGRLIKLVNTLLDFSRIEAGRAQAAFEPTDLAELSVELASNFRGAVERAGIQLVVDCPPLPAPVFVDRDMWEKVVLNLISNAFKHTFDGRIEVRVRADGATAELSVSDTGVGIAADQLPRIFDRFHRVPNVRSRTHEGTGIGLSLVQEIVRLHGGRIEARSEEGVGSTFTVRLPFGDAHLPADRLAPPRRLPSTTWVGASLFVEEAARWLPGESVSPDSQSSVAAASSGESRVESVRETAAARILVADDNADMREYLARLLHAKGWQVQSVADGRAALSAALANRPDLVLTDAMMPELDGFALIQALRADDRTRDVPIVLLSARAGEEAKVEGLAAGADDYVVKPFSARELVARVDSQLALARLRRESRRDVEAARDDAIRARAEAEVANRTKSDFLAAMSHELRTPLNAIGGYAQLIDLGVHGPVTEAQQQALARIQRSQQHLLALINDVLNFTKLESGRVEYSIEDVPVASAIADVAPMIEAQFATKGLIYEVRVDPGVVVRADREKLGQILLNLLSNAVKFTDGGGRVAVETTGRADAPPGVAFVRIADTGLGIRRDRQDMIFDPFVQVHRNLRRNPEGTGLGLAISRDLARGMNGDLRVRSAEGEGSRFTLTLPSAAQD